MRIKNLPSIESMDGSQDALVIEQTDGSEDKSRKVSPSQLKQYILNDMDIDSSPTAGSNNAVASGGTKTYVDNAVSRKTEYFISSTSGTTQTINIGAAPTENRIFLFACGFHTNHVLELIAMSGAGSVVHIPIANSSINSISNISYNANTGVMTITVLNKPFTNGRMTRLS